MPLLDCDRQILLKDDLIEPVVAAPPTTLQLLREQTGSIITNKLNSNDIHIYLPAVTPFSGLYFKFVVISGYDVKIETQSGWINLTDSTGTLNQYDYINTDVVGSSVFLVAGESNEWHIFGMTGLWSGS